MRNQLCLLLACLASFFLEAQNTKSEKIDLLIELMGSKEGYEQVYSELFQSYINEGTTYDSVFFTEFSSTVVGSYDDAMLPILKSNFDQYLSEEEIDELLTVYRNPDFRKAMEKYNRMNQAILMQFSNKMKVAADSSLKRAERIIAQQDQEKMIKVHQGCNLYHEGEFYFVLPDSAQIHISRKGNRQVETIEDGRSELQIDWLNDCKYVLTLLETNDPYRKRFIGQKIEVNIYSSDSTSCHYYIQIDGEEDVYEGEVFRDIP